MTLEQIIEREKNNRNVNALYGVDACKETILAEIKRHQEWNKQNKSNRFNTSLYVLLEKYVKLANEDIFFNKTMVLACWELINSEV